MKDKNMEVRTQEIIAFLFYFSNWVSFKSWLCQFAYIVSQKHICSGDSKENTDVIRPSVVEAPNVSISRRS